MQLKLKTSKNAICCKMQHLEEQVSRLISCRNAEFDAHNNSLSALAALLRDLEQNRRSVKALRNQFLASESVRENVLPNLAAGSVVIRNSTGQSGNQQGSQEINMKYIVASDLPASICTYNYIFAQVTFYCLTMVQYGAIVYCIYFACIYIWFRA